MAELAIVGFYLSLNAFILLYLSSKVIAIRRSEGVSLGDGGNKTLLHRIRGQGNASEYMPIFFLLLGVAALLSAPPIALHLFGAVFTLGRLMHAYWFLKMPEGFKPRFFGMVLTLASISLLAISLFVHCVVIMAGGYS